MSSRVSSLCLVLALAGTAACSSTNSNTPSGSLTAVFTENLAGTNEVPAATGSEANVTGAATITMTYTQDSSGNVSTATANFQVSLSGLTSSSVITMAHIHQAPVGVAGAIVVNTGLASGSVTITNGSASFTVNSVNVPATIAQQLLTNSASFYFNVHTVENPGGVSRGQLVRTQ